MDRLTASPHRTNLRSYLPSPVEHRVDCIDGGLLDAEKMVEQGLPIGRYPGITLRNAHFQYIVTWYPPRTSTRVTCRYSLAIVTTGMCYFLFRKPRATYAERVLSQRAFGAETPRGMKGWS